MSVTRTTTNGVLMSYRDNLYTSNNNLTKARNTVLTQRNFSSFSEDPAAATQAFQLRRSWHRIDAQYTVNQNATAKFNSAWSVLESVSEMVDTDASNSALTAALRGNSDTTASGRNALGAELSQLAESIIQSMNSQYGDDFMFAGADGMNVPFSWSGDTLLYRGIDVSASPNATATMTLPAGATVATLGSTDIDGTPLSQLFDAKTADGTAIDWTDTATTGTITLTAKSEGALTDAQSNALKNVAGLTVTDDGSNYQKLKALSEEPSYVDIGLGMQLDDNGDVIPASVFNSSLPGINYLGYGTDEDGDSQNIAVLLKRMGQLLNDCDSNGNWASEEDSVEFDRLIGKMEEASNNFKSSLVELDTKASFLSQNGTKLLSTADTVNEQFLDIEQCDLADAITSFSWAQYCYNAALKVGNSILSQSLIDYMD